MAVEMKLPPVLEIIRGNIVKYGNPLALKGSEVAAWARDLNLPSQGQTLFYTGGEYQLLPYIDALVKTMTRMDQSGKSFSLMLGVRNMLDRAGINAEKLYASALAKDKQRYNSICYQAAVILRELGYDLCYSGEQELYSGALLYELGFWNELPAYADKVSTVIKQSGAKTIVCLSPHAAEVFKLVYPRFGQDLQIEVRTFVDLVWEKRNKLWAVAGQGPVVIHDSCRLARELGVEQEIRDILECAGVECREALRSRRWTTCCGGPGKLLYPEVCQTVAGRRLQELEQTGAEQILTSCPYCLAALQGGTESKNRAAVVDLIEFLNRGLGK